MLLLGILNIWSGIEGENLSKGYLVMGSMHIVLAIGLIIRINAAKIVSILICVGGALISIVYGLIASFWGYQMNMAGNHLVSSLSDKGLTEQQAETASNIVQAIPWVLVVSSIFFIAAYLWIFLFLTSEQGTKIFSGGSNTDTPENR